MLTTNPLTIEAVEQQFADWRANKQGKRKIPQVLWDQIRILMEHHSLSMLLKRLGISSTQARNNNLIPAKKRTMIKKISKDFVKIPLPEPILSKAFIPTITFKRGELILSLENPSVAHLDLFIQKLLGVK